MADNSVFITKQGKINFVDLAGSEMTKKTNSVGKTLEEANNINTSLMVLGYCIASLSDPKKRSGHIPYRDSKLTKLLSDSLAGSGVTLMIACVSPSLSNVSETLNTLRYAARAKKIRTKPIVVMDPRESLIVSLKREVLALQNENEHLRIALDLSKQHAEDMQKLSGSRQDLKTPPHIDLEKIAQMEGLELVDLIKHYAIENEALRKENADLFNSRDMLMRDHEIVCRENEKLLKKLEAVNSACVRSPIITARSSYSGDKSNHHDADTSNESSNNTSADSAFRSSSGSKGNGTADSKSRKSSPGMPESIQKEMDKKGIGRTLQTSHEDSYDISQRVPSVNSFNLLVANQAFGSLLSSADSIIQDIEPPAFDELPPTPLLELNKTYAVNSANHLHGKRSSLPAYNSDDDHSPSPKLPDIFQQLQVKKDRNYRNPFGSAVSSAAL